jgi:hypothetical protein
MLSQQVCTFALSFLFFLNLIFLLATSYFHLPIDEQEDAEIEGYHRKSITYIPQSSQPESTYNDARNMNLPIVNPLIQQILSSPNLYNILGIPNTPVLDRSTLRRAYLSRSRACHPDKFPSNSELYTATTEAFQRVSLAYTVLSRPSSRRSYDLRTAAEEGYNPFETPTAAAVLVGTSAEAALERVRAEETLRGAVAAALNEFLDGDLEMIGCVLRTVVGFQPRGANGAISEEAIEKVLKVIEAVRMRMGRCRACVYALHYELTRLGEMREKWATLGYLDLRGRTRIGVGVARIAIGLPIAVEKALKNDTGMGEREDKEGRLTAQIRMVIGALDLVLERLEGVLK